MRRSSGSTTWSKAVEVGGVAGVHRQRHVHREAGTRARAGFVQRAGAGIEEAAVHVQRNFQDRLFVKDGLGAVSVMAVYVHDGDPFPGPGSRGNIRATIAMSLNNAKAGGPVDLRVVQAAAGVEGVIESLRGR